MSCDVNKTPWVAILLLYLLPLTASQLSPASQVCLSSSISTRTMPILTRKQKLEFIEKGYILLPEPLPADLVSQAETHVNWAHSHKKYNEAPGGAKKGSTKPNLNFYKPIRQSEHITNLFFKTYLETLANELLDGHALLRESLGQIAFTGTSDIAVKEGMPKHQMHPSGGWHIDAGHAEYRDAATDFSFLIGIALSEGQEIDENRGQFIVFPGSHVHTQNRLREIVESGEKEIMDTFRKTKPKVGQAVRVLLKKGHVMIAHQRLAHAPGINLSDVVRKNIYFRIVHDQHDDLIRTHMVAPTPWTGFYGLRRLLPEGATEGL